MALWPGLTVYTWKWCTSRQPNRTLQRFKRCHANLLRLHHRIRPATAANATPRFITHPLALTYPNFKHVITATTDSSVSPSPQRQSCCLQEKMSDFYSAFPQTLHAHHLQTLTTFLASTETELSKSSLLRFLAHKVTKIDLLLTHQSSFNPVQTTVSQTDYQINLQQEHILRTLTLLVETISSKLESLAFPSFPHVVQFHHLFHNIAIYCPNLTHLSIHYHPEHYKQRFNIVLQNFSSLKQLCIINPDEHVLSSIAESSTVVESIQLYNVPHHALYLVPDVLRQNRECLQSLTIHVNHPDCFYPLAHTAQLQNERKFLKSLLNTGNLYLHSLSRLCLLLSKETALPGKECFKVFQQSYPQNVEIQLGSNDMHLIRSLKPKRNGIHSDLILQISQKCPLFSEIQNHAASLHKLDKLDLSAADFFDNYCQNDCFRRDVKFALETSNCSLQHINMQRTPSPDHCHAKFMQFMVFVFSTSHTAFTLSCSTLFISAFVKACFFPEMKALWNRLIPRLSSVQKIELHGLPHCANPSQCWDCAIHSLEFLDSFPRFLSHVVPHMDSLRAVTLFSPVKITEGEHKTNFQCSLEQARCSLKDFDQHLRNIDLSVLDIQFQIWLSELNQ